MKIKFFIFKGSLEDFKLFIPKKHTRFLSLINYIGLKEERDLYQNIEIDEESIVVYSNDYLSVREHVVENFYGYISMFKFKNVYIQNPPNKLEEQLNHSDQDVEIHYGEYKKITLEDIKYIKDTFDEKIIGQSSVKEDLLAALYPLAKERMDKPLILMFYGESGVGKTEVAKLIAKKLGDKLLRKQFSMFQSTSFETYLFGGKCNESSFAKDLLDRESNVVLLDEFDKSNTVFHSAFYQLFDEGIYEDKNYNVDMKNTLIICTSNYKSRDEMKKKLGAPIYSRFDKIIEFNNLCTDSKYRILEDILNTEYSKLDEDEINNIDINRVKMAIKKNINKISNVREIKNLTREMIYLELLNNI